MRRYIAAALIVLLAGCSEDLSHDPVAAPQAVPGVKPGFNLVLPVHESSDLTEYVLNGTDAELRSGGAVDSGSAVILDGNASGFEYAVYRFNPGLDAPDSVSVLLEEPATSGAWVGIANYAEDKWEFDGPFIKQKTFVIDDPAYISPAGNIWVAVLAPASSVTVNALSVRTIRPDNEPPVADVVADITGGSRP
jgi:hypothetical protein